MISIMQVVGRALAIAVVALCAGVFGAEATLGSDGADPSYVLEAAGLCILGALILSLLWD